AKGTNCGSFKPSRTYPGIRGAMTWSTNRGPPPAGPSAESSVTPRRNRRACRRSRPVRGPAPARG
ncbi:hypothetical protein AB0L03_24935, partial [Streptomyces roseoverticillatus]